MFILNTSERRYLMNKNKSIYISIPLLEHKRGIVREMFNQLCDNYKDLSYRFWMPNTTYYEEHLKDSDYFGIVLEGECWKDNISNLPVGCHKEYLKAKELGKRIFLIYKSSNGWYIYDTQLSNTTIEGIAGTTKSINRYIGIDNFRINENSNPCMEISLPLPSDHCHSKNNIVNETFDRRILLQYNK